jgi:hypothetical protein
MLHLLIFSLIPAGVGREQQGQGYSGTYTEYKGYHS